MFFALIKLSAAITYREAHGAQAYEEEKQEGDEPEVMPTVKVDQKKIFKNLAEIIESLKDNNPEIALRLNLQAVQAINNVSSPSELEDQAYDFMSNAFIIFEEELSEADAKISALNIIVTTLYSLTCFGSENFDTLCANAVSYSGKLLKKNQQAEAITLSAHLYFCTSKRDGKKVMDQLRKALKTSEICMTKPENLYLIIKILNAYLYFFQSA